MILKLLDKDEELSIGTANSFNIYFSYGSETVYQKFLRFDVTEVKRDEKTGELTITGYDLLDKALAHTVSELTLTKPYTIADFCEACGTLIGASSVIGHTDFTLSYTNGANFEGAETLRDALDDVAEATQTIYFIDSANRLCFKQLDVSGDSVLSINNNLYFNLNNSGQQRLQTICSATELGDNVAESSTLSGVTQYVRDNAFWELRDDIATLVHNAITAVGGITANQFECEWRGNYYTEPGDKLTLVSKNGESITSYLLNDTVIYNGGLHQKTSWTYKDSQETAANPTSLGDVIKKTYAKVDKQEKQITLVASESQANSEEIAQLKLNQNSISATVSSVQDTVIDMQNGINQQNESNAEQFETLTKKVDATMTSEQVQIKISEALENGVDRVTTTTGFTFNDEGLTISKSDSEISTNIDEDGMSIMKGSEEVLTADNTGVNAINLTAHQYLIIGNNSRFEDYGSNRTGCFWIGN